MKKFFIATILAATSLCMTAAPAGKSFHPVIKSDVKAAELTQKTKPSRIAIVDPEDKEGDANWESLGMATYTDDYVASLFNVDNYTYQVEIQEKKTQPGFYRLVNPYGEAYPASEGGTFDGSKHYMYIHAENPGAVYIEKHISGFSIGNYGVMTMWSLADYAVETGQLTLEDCIAEGICGTMEDGIITFPVNALLVSLANYNNDQLMYANSNSKFLLALPGVEVKDYSIKVINESCGADNVAYYMVKVGEDVAKVEQVLLPGNIGLNAENFASIHENAEALGVEELELNEDMLYEMAIPGPGVYTLCLMALDAKGNLQEGTGCTFYGIDNSNDGWKSLGLTKYTDGIISGLYDVPAETMDVEIHQSIETPTLYRLVNPYINHSLSNDGNQYHSGDHNHYIYIHIDADDEVYVEESPIGMDLGYGGMAVTSFAWMYLENGYSVEDIKANDVFGSFNPATREVTFPEKSLLVIEADTPQQHYYADSSAFKVVIPAIADEPVNPNPGEDPDPETSHLYVVGNATELTWDPEYPIVVNAAGGKYTFDLTIASSMKISTAYGDWDNFNEEAMCIEGNFNEPGSYVLTAGTQDIIFPWKGDWHIEIPTDLSYITATTDTPRPGIGEIIPAYIRGNCNGWDVDEDWRFESTDGVVYTLYVEDPEKVAALTDTRWKIADADWGIINFEASEPVYVDDEPAELLWNAPDQDMRIEWDGAEMTAVTIIFTYNGEENSTVQILSGASEPMEACEMPELTVNESGLISTYCGTEGATIHTSIKCPDATVYDTNNGGNIQLDGVYEITVYATAKGYSRSKECHYTLVWLKGIEASGVETLEVGTERALLAHNVGGYIELLGTADNEDIRLYSLSGQLLYEGVTTASSYTIPVALIPGDIYFIQIDDRIIKYQF